MTPKRYFYTTWRLAVLFTRRYFRSKTAMFFSILFPIILLFIFGGIFGNSNSTKIKVAVIDQAKTGFSGNFSEQLTKNPVFTVVPVASLAEGETKMGRSEIDSVIVLPAGFGLPDSQKYPSGQAQVLYDQANAQAGQTVASILNGTFMGINASLTGITPPLGVVTKSTAQNGLTAFDYSFTGLIGFSLLGLGIFGPINTLPALKKTGALRRFRTTPVRPLQFILAYMMSALAAGVVAIAAQFAVAMIFFHFHMRGSYLVFALFTLFAAIMIFGFGMAVGGWANDEKQSAPLGNLVTFPMMFLSGVFFPRFLMPEWLQHISAYIPLSPAIDGMRMIALENKSLLELGPQLGLMGAWIIAIYILAFRVFRWE
jgi:ABC-2 type transport system permease protein